MEVTEVPDKGGSRSFLGNAKEVVSSANRQKGLKVNKSSPTGAAIWGERAFGGPLGKCGYVRA